MAYSLTASVTNASKIANPIRRIAETPNSGLTLWNRWRKFKQYPGQLALLTNLQQMTDVPFPLSAVCPMCGRSNQFSASDVLRRDVGEWGADDDSGIVAQCVDCGEAIALAGPTEPTRTRAHRWEVWAAFTLLASIGVWLVYNLISM